MRNETTAYQPETLKTAKKFWSSVITPDTFLKPGTGFSNEVSPREMTFQCIETESGFGKDLCGHKTSGFGLNFFYINTNKR